MRKVFFITLGLLVTLMTVVLIGVPFAVHSARPRVEEHLQNLMKERCSTCAFHLEDLHWYWLNGLVFEGVHITGGPKGGQEIDAKIKSVALWPVFDRLLNKELRFSLVVVEKPSVTFTDGENVRPEGRHFEDPDEGMIRSYAVDRLRVNDGTFTYIRNLKGTHAVFSLHQMQLSTDAFGTTADLKPDTAKAHITAQIGERGQVALDLACPLYAKPLQIDSELQVRDQSLEELSKFFKPNAGVELKGTLVKGSATSHLRDRHLKTSVLAEYKNFSLKVDPMYDRSELVAFLTNLGASIAMREKNVHKEASDQTKTVETGREARESIVSFLLRGIKEASIDIAHGDTAASHRLKN